MFFYVSYSANIVALLQAPSSRIKTLEDLYHSGLELGIHDTVYNRHFAPLQTEKTRKLIYEKKIMNSKRKGGNFFSLAEGIERIRHGLFAFYYESGIGYKLMLDTYDEHEKCGLQQMPYLHIIVPYFATPKNCSYRELFKVG